MRVILILCLVITAVFGDESDVNSTNCGKQFYQPHTPPSGSVSSYIVGGREAIPHSWPWQVVLRFRTQTLTCGGSLITGSSGELVVLTAAQCVDGSIPADWKVDIGVHSRSAVEANQKTYDVAQIIVHESYSPYYLQNDIAIIRLTSTVTENEVVSPICVTTIPTSDFYGDNCVVIGWGATVEGGQPADRLKEVYKPVINDTQCSTNVGGAFDPNTMMCAGYLEGGKGACANDNGGPLMCKNVNGQYDLIGIVSWGFGCAREGFPAVYADVHKYIDWINKNTL